MQRPRTRVSLSLLVALAVALDIAALARGGEGADAIDLAPGEPLALVVTTTEDRPVYRVSRLPGRTLLFRVDGLAALEAASLLYRANRPASDSLDADLVVTGRPGESVCLFVPSEASGEGYLTVRPELLGDATPARWSLLHEAPEGPIVGDVEPRYAGELRPQSALPPVATAQVYGGGFDDATRFTFIRNEAGQPRRRFPANARVVGPGLANLALDLDGIPVGRYDVEAVDGEGRSVVSPRAFEIRSSRGQALQVALRGPEIQRELDRSVLILTIRNAGDETLPPPLVRIRCASHPGRFAFRPSGADSPPEAELLVFGRSSAKNSPVTLAPGQTVNIPIELRGNLRCETPGEDGTCEVVFEASVFRPSARAFIPWREFENPDPENVTDSDWRRLLSGISVGFDRDWAGFERRLVDRLVRLSRRGRGRREPHDAFLFAALEAEGRPSAAVAGQLLDASGTTPIRRTTVVAYDARDDVVIASSVSDFDGRFVLEGLRPGSPVRIGVDRHTLLGARNARIGPLGLAGVALPADLRSREGSGDATDVSLRIEPGGPERTGLPDGRLYAGLPRRLPRLPDAFFVQVAAWVQRISSSIDPNEKTGCVGPGDLRTIGSPTAGTFIDYTIRFENSRCSDLAAREVEIVDTLDAAVFDLETLEIGSLSIGDDDPAKTISLAEPLWGVWRVERELEDVRIAGFGLPDPIDCAGGALPECDGEATDSPEAVLPTNPIGPVRVSISLTESSERENAFDLRWIFRSCDAGCAPEEGFLPPNNCATHQGEGYVSFRIAARSTSGDVGNEASVRFDNRTLTLSATTSIDPVVPLAAADPSPPDDPDGTRPVGVDTSLVWTADEVASSWELSLWRLDAAGERVETLEDQRVLEEPTYLVAEPWSPSTSYEWSILPIGEAGPAADASVWRFRTEDPLPPPPDVEIAVVEPAADALVDADAVEFSWSATTGDAPESWTVFVWPAGSERGEPSAHLGSSTTYDPFDLEPGTSYEWQVVAANAGGETQGPISGFSTSSDAPRFERGDANSDGQQDVSDAVGVLSWLFVGAESPNCLDAADTDDSGDVEITDPIALLGYLFLGGEPPPPPFPECGEDPSPDALGCDAPAACA